MFNDLLLYVDPSTGSMFFAVIIGLVSAIFFGVKGFMMKMKQNLGVGKKSFGNEHKLNYVIFSDHKRYWNVFEPICDEFEKRKVEVHYWTMSPDDPALKKPYNYVKTEFIGEGNIGFAKLNFMNAHVCLSTTPGLDVYQWKRSKDVDKYLHCFHSAGLNSGGYKMFGTDYYDELLIVSEGSCDCIRELERKRNLPAKKFTLVGSTYLDAMKERYEKMQKNVNEKKKILLAPSWGESSILEKYGTKFLDKLVDNSYDIIIRPHPETVILKPELINQLKDKYKNRDNVTWNFDLDNFDCLSKADLMISDFSGVIFDYILVFDRPVIFTDVKKDKSSYDDAQLDNKFWREDILRTVGYELNENNFENIKSMIEESFDNDKFKEGRIKLKKLTWGNIGHAKETIVDYILSI